MNTAQNRRPTRDQRRERTLAAARAILEAEGARAVTARRIAEDCRYSVGTLYNLFETVDALVAELNLSTLVDLEQALAAEALPSGIAAEDALLHIARVALDFTTRNRARWAAVLEFVPTGPHGREAATATAAERLIGHLEQALEPLGDTLAPAERRLSAAVLWASFEGIVGLTMARTVAAVTEADAWAMVRALVTNYVRGLAAAARGER